MLTVYLDMNISVKAQLDHLFAGADHASKRLYATKRDKKQYMD